jgi:hypothetical protein
MNGAVSVLPLYAFMVGTGKTVPSNQLDRKRGKIKYIETMLH